MNMNRCATPHFNDCIFEDLASHLDHCVPEDIQSSAFNIIDVFYFAQFELAK